MFGESPGRPCRCAYLRIEQSQSGARVRGQGVRPTPWSGYAVICSPCPVPLAPLQIYASKHQVTTCTVRVHHHVRRESRSPLSVRLFAHRTEPKRGEGQGAGGPAHAMVGPCGDLFPLPRAPCPASNICIKSSGYDMFGESPPPCSARVPVAPVGAPIRASNRAKAGRGSGGRGQGSGPHHGRAMRRSVPPAPRPLPRFKYMHQIIRLRHVRRERL
jgi:hypothetical protein